MKKIKTKKASPDGNDVGLIIIVPTTGDQSMRVEFDLKELNYPLGCGIDPWKWLTTDAPQASRDFALGTIMGGLESYGVECEDPEMLQLLMAKTGEAN